jgi:hypothetical protein
MWPRPIAQSIVPEVGVNSVTVSAEKMGFKRVAYQYPDFTHKARSQRSASRQRRPVAPTGSDAKFDASPHVLRKSQAGGAGTVDGR